jgi:hypothetical protein
MTTTIARRPHSRVTDFARYNAPITAAIPPLRVGDRVRFLEDYCVIIVGAVVGPTREYVYAHRGEVGRVVWAGRDRRFRARGAAARLFRWRLGIMFPGETEPIFIIQRNYGQMEKA